MNRLKELFARLQRTRPWRAWKRYGDAHGNVLAGGVGYFAFFSVFPAVALAFAVFGFVLRGQPDLLNTVFDALREQLPGMIKDPSNPGAGGIIPAKAPGADALTITGIVALVTLLISGMGWLGAKRTGIRAVFGVDDSPGNFVTDKLRDLGVMLSLGLGIALSGIFTSVASSLIRWVAGLVGFSGASWLLQIGVLVISALADTGLMILLLRALSGVPVGTRGLFQGALIGGVGLTLMKAFAGQLISHATSNPLMASLGIVVGLLFWLNLMSRLTLLSAAWAANDLDVATARETAGAEATAGAGGGATEGAADQSANAGAGQAGSTVRAGVPVGPPRRTATGIPLRPKVGPRSVPVAPSFATRESDRASLAAGAVLGATGALAVGSVGRLARVARDVIARR
jgi:membrane protein